MNIFVLYIGWALVGCVSILAVVAIIGLTLFFAQWYIKHRWVKLKNVLPAAWLEEAVFHYAKVKGLPKGTYLNSSKMPDFSNKKDLD